MTDVIIAPPHPEAYEFKPIPVSTTDTDAKALIDTVNQRFYELARTQKEHIAAGSGTAEEVRQVKAQLDEAATSVAELATEFDKVNNALIAQANAANAATEEEDGLGDAPGDPRATETWDRARDEFWRSGNANLTDDQRNALGQGDKFAKLMHSATAAQLRDPKWDPMAAVLAGGWSTTFGPGSGIWARPQYDTQLTRKLVEFSPIRGFARVMPINAGEFIGVITTANRGTVEKVNEGAEPTQQTQKDQFQQRNIRVYTYQQRPALTPEMIEDGVIDLEAEMLNQTGLSFAVDESALFTTGSGANEPLGYAADTDVGGITSETSATISHQDLLNVALSLRPAYRTADAAYAFSTTAFRLAILDEDGMGRRLWQPSVSAGFPSMYNGWRYFEATEQATVAASSKSVFFANWNLFYRIVDRRGTRVVRDEVTNPGLIILNHSRRFGGKTWLTEAGKVLTTKA